MKIKITSDSTCDLSPELCDVFAAMWRPLIRRLGVGFKKEETT